MRWTYCSGTLGSSKLNTWLTPGISIPRAAMSVATSTRTEPERKPLIAAVRRAPALVAAADRGARNARRGEMAHDPVRAMFGPGEDERAIDRTVAQPFTQAQSQQRLLFRLVEERGVLFDAFGGGRLRATSTRTGSWMNCLPRSAIALGIVAEKNRLCRSLGSSAAIRFNGWIAEVHHLVCFIQHEDFDMAQSQRALIDQVEQAARLSPRGYRCRRPAPAPACQRERRRKCTARSAQGTWHSRACFRRSGQPVRASARAPACGTTRSCAVWDRRPAGAAKEVKRRRSCRCPSARYPEGRALRAARGSPAAESASDRRNPFGAQCAQNGLGQAEVGKIGHAILSKAHEPRPTRHSFRVRMMRPCVKKEASGGNGDLYVRAP